MKIEEQKPKIRKTKEEVIHENEMMYLIQRKNGGPPKPRAQSSNGLSKNTLATIGNLHTKKANDLMKLKANQKFDEIPDDSFKPLLKAPPKPKTSKQVTRKPAKEEKPLTEKLTNIALDTRTMTSHNVERRIAKLHSTPKELTQKPNFGQYQPPQGPPSGQQ